MKVVFPQRPENRAASHVEQRMMTDEEYYSDAEEVGVKKGKEEERKLVADDYGGWTGCCLHGLTLTPVGGFPQSRDGPSAAFGVEV